MADGILKRGLLKEESDKAKLDEASSGLREGRCLEAILRWPQVKELVNLSRVTVWRMERRGLFPGRVTLGSNSCGWRLSEISSWLDSRPRAGRVVEGGK